MFDKKRFRQELDRAAEKAKREFPFALFLALGSLAISVGMMLVGDGSSFPIVSVIMAIPTAVFGSWAISLWNSCAVDYAKADDFIEHINARAARLKSKG